MAPKPVAVDLAWAGGFRFEATSAANTLTVDGDSVAGPSPVQLMVCGLAACMAIDVLDIVRKGRHEVTAFRTSLAAERAETPPRRLLRATLSFELHGRIPEAAVERAITLSRDKYCSVWHSLREDIQLSTSFEVRPPVT
jgi:putative redox protein